MHATNQAAGTGLPSTCRLLSEAYLEGVGMLRSPLKNVWSSPSQVPKKESMGGGREGPKRGEREGKWGKRGVYLRKVPQIVFADEFWREKEYYFL